VATSHLRPGRTAETTAHAPNAALLIDFDNVTLGVRSDLTKELRTLLNSDMIRGKVAVQRAYADWRRYVQYVMPLSERSIDLIFAPAVGSTKKNATDIRLAIDAMELVFTRPEIGTFILLSGDSDFSSLVVKLKEYGKYVIGVGIRESASDLLIQNCDEYFSYSDLAGLTKESDAPTAPRDPWDLVKEAVAQMARNRDVMRSDRLKQVMQQIDTNFDERNAGFSRFSKFVMEAGTKGLLKVTKLDNGQFDVAPLDGVAAAVAAPAAAPAREEGERREEGGAARRGRRRGRGGRERGDAPRTEAGTAAVAATPTPSAPAEPREPRGAPSSRAVAPVGPVGLTLATAFALLTEAMGGMQAPVPHEALRLRMASMHGREDVMLEPARFERFLRQANDAEICDVRKLGEHEFEVMPFKHEEMRSRGVIQAPPSGDAAGNGNGAAAEPTVPMGLRSRRGSRGPARPNELLMVGMVKSPSVVTDQATVVVLEPATPAPASATLDVVVSESEGESASPLGAVKKNRRGGRRVKAAKEAKAKAATTVVAPVAAKAEAPAKPAKAAKAAKKKAAPKAAKKKAE
jgi:uncharacterized protein (TIGR00288 family)